jgi:hypothetical protein
VTIIPIAVGTLADPKTFPTTVGIVAKKPPFAAPLMTTKRARGARVVDDGHRASILTAVSTREMKRVLRGPNLSQRRPQMIRPIADEKLKPASNPAPVLEDSPIDRLYRGIKNGGTSNGNVPTAPAAKTSRNPGSLKSRLFRV